MEKLSTVDLPVLTSLDQLLSKLKILFIFLQKQVTLMRSSNVLSLPHHLEFHNDDDKKLWRQASLRYDMTI
jgi:hypothetical protein